MSNYTTFKMFVNGDIEGRFRIQRGVLCAKYRHPLRKRSIVSQLPDIAAGSITQRLRFSGTVRMFVIESPGPELKTEAVHWTIKELPPVADSQHVTLTITLK